MGMLYDLKSPIMVHFWVSAGFPAIPNAEVTAKTVPITRTDFHLLIEVSPSGLARRDSTYWKYQSLQFR